MTTLAIDALYLRTAREAYARALAATKYISRAESTVANLNFKIRTVYEPDDVDERGEPYVDVGGKYYEQIEGLAIQIENAEYRLGETHGPFLQSLATAHILCTASLEAHINVRAQDRLEGRLRDAFERLALDAKWLFLPRVLGLDGFDPGAEPFQSFDHLVRTRNKLVHYRVHREPWRSPGIPEFLAQIGLSFLSKLSSRQSWSAEATGRKPASRSS